MLISHFFKKEYTHHTDKHVRKAVVKLIKDCLKGSIFIYPKDISPYDYKLKNVIGAPNNFCDGQYTWYVPSSETLARGTYFNRFYFIIIGAVIIINIIVINIITIITITPIIFIDIIIIIIIVVTITKIVVIDVY